MAANIDIVFTCFILSSFAISQTFSFLTKPIMLDYTSLLTIDESGKWDTPALDFTSDNPNNIKFDQQATLSEEGDVKLWWNFNEENITFKMSARTLGWMGVGIALNESGKVVVDYVVMGYKKYNSYLFDMYMNDNGEYISDASQDITQLSIWQEGNVTFAIFSRPLVTGDHLEDNDITSDTLNVVWAFGSEDPQEYIPKKGELIATNSGSIHIKLLNPKVLALGTDLQEPTTPEPHVTTVADENDQTTLPEFWSGTTASFVEKPNKVTPATSEGIDTENPGRQGTDDPDSKTDNTDSGNSEGQGTDEPESKTDNTDNVNERGQNGSEQEDSGTPSTGDEDTDESSVTTYSDNNGLDKTTTTTKGPDKGVLDESKAPEKIIANECPVSCENEGKCQFRDSNDAVATLEAYCECQDGFEGDKCENTVSDTEGFPILIIIVIVLGSIIVTLFFLLSLSFIKFIDGKKGEYKVVTQIQKWARFGKKKRNVADIPDAPEAEEGKATSPTTRNHE